MKLLLGLIEYNFCAYQKDIEFCLLRLSVVNISYIWLMYGFCKKYYRYPFVMKKVFNWSELHLSEVTSYKIHILKVATFEFKFRFNLLFAKYLSYLKDSMSTKGS
jgi:hypothetical protein